MIGGRGIPATHGGVERAVEELSVRLAERGHHVTVFCRNQYNPAREPEYREVHLTYQPCINTKHLEAITHTALATLMGNLAGRFDIYHFSATGPGLFSIVPRLLGRKSVVTVQGLDFQRSKWGKVARAFLRCCAHAVGSFPHETIVVSRKLQRYYQDRYGRKTTYIPNGVPPAELRPLPKDNRFQLEPGRYSLFLSRIVPEKGCHTLIKAYRQARTDFPLAICGDPLHMDTYYRELRELAAGDGRVRFLGGVYGEDKENIFSSAALYVHPSDIEGLPISLLEAMSYGRAVLVSDIEENAEVLGSPPQAGRLFRCGDVDDLRDQLDSLLSDSDERERLGRLALQRVRTEYDWETITGRVEHLYERLLR